MYVGFAVYSPTVEPKVPAGLNLILMLIIICILFVQVSISYRDSCTLEEGMVSDSSDDGDATQIACEKYSLL